MENGVYVASLTLYMILLPLSIYNFWTHRWAGLFAWYYLTAFCILRIVAGALGTSQGDSLAASILIGVGTSPLLLSVDGLVHEARSYRNPSQNLSKWLGWGFIYIITALMAAAIALTATGAMDVYQGHHKQTSLFHWKVGSALMIAAWVFEVAWACFSLLPSQARRNAPAYWQGTVILGGTLIALFFLGIRVIYAHVAVRTQRQELSPVYGTTAVRLVLMFFPEALTTIIIIFIGFATGRSPSSSRPNASTTTRRR